MSFVCSLPSQAYGMYDITQSCMSKPNMPNAAARAPETYEPLWRLRTYGETDMYATRLPLCLKFELIP